MRYELGGILADYPVTQAGPPSSTFPKRGNAAINALIAQFGRATLGDGLYRLHDEQSALAGEVLIAKAFPDFKIPVEAFGFDWLGRQFASDGSRGRSDDPEVLMFDVETGDVLEIPLPISEFHSIGYEEYADAIWATDLYSTWRTQHSAALAFEDCVGYKVPLCLGGSDSLDNMEVTNMAVYWHLTGQLRQSTSGLETGRIVGQVDTE